MKIYYVRVSEDATLTLFAAAGQTTFNLLVRVHAVLYIVIVVVLLWLLNVVGAARTVRDCAHVGHHLNGLLLTFVTLIAARGVSRWLVIFYRLFGLPTTLFTTLHARVTFFFDWVFAHLGGCGLATCLLDLGADSKRGYIRSATFFT